MESSSSLAALTGAGSEIEYKFGKRVNFQMRQSRSVDFLKHGHLTEDATCYKAVPSVNETRFTKGFYRRPHSNIENDNMDKCIAYAKHKMKCKALLEEHKREEGLKRSKVHGFDIITCIQYDKNERIPPRKDQIRGRKRFEAEISKTGVREGVTTMRSSPNRFFACEERNPAIIKQRADRLFESGIDRSKKNSSIIGHGNADIPSVGVGDNFYNSYWLELSRKQLNRVNKSTLY